VDAGQEAAAVSRLGGALSAVAITCIALLALAGPVVAARPEEELRAAWVGHWVVLRTAALSNCDERYTNNRMRGPQPSSGGRHRFDPGEMGRLNNLHLQRARIDLLVTLLEPLRVELRDGPFQLYEQLECRVELEVPAPREAVRQGATDQLDGLIQAVLERHEAGAAADASPIWNRRRVEPLPDDHEERLAAYHAWKQEQLYIALRGRLAEALDRAADITSDGDRSVAYAEGLLLGMRELERHSFYSTDCVDLPGEQIHPGWRKAPEELDKRDARDWRDGFEDGQRLRFEVALARRIERCLP
jgi:hypothetical protein